MSQIEKMKHLMSYGVIKEHSLNPNGSVEYTKKGADNHTYGIIREGIKYYVKICNNTEKPNLAESFDYIGGFCDKKKNEFKGYNDAVKHLQFKLISLNEAHVNNQVSVDILNPEKKKELVIEGTEKMKSEILRQRQLMHNSDMIIKEGNSIGFNNTGVPDAPETTKFTDSIGKPFEEKTEAVLDNDFTKTSSDFEKQGTPFNQKANIGMQSNKNPQGGKDESQDFKSVEMNEDVDDFVGFDGGDETFTNDEETFGDIGYEDFKPSNGGKDIMSDDEFEQILNQETNGNQNQFESKINKNNLIENIVNRILKEATENSGERKFKIYDNVWFRKNNMQPLESFYNKIMNNYEGIAESDDMEEVDAMFKDYEVRATKLVNVITAILNDKKLNISNPNELEKLTATIKSNPTAAEDIVKSINYGKALSAERWDKKVAQVKEDDFNKKNQEWNERKGNMGYDTTDEMAKLERQDNEFKNENRKYKKVNEENATFNDFGKHPGYQKKPLTLPTDSENDNDASIKDDKPFGQQIGNSAPFDQKVKLLSDAIMNKLMEAMEKKK